MLRCHRGGRDRRLLVRARRRCSTRTSPQARRIAAVVADVRLAAGVYVIVIALVVWRSSAAGPATTEPGRRRSERATDGFLLLGGLVLPTVVLAVVAVADRAGEERAAQPQATACSITSSRRAVVVAGDLSRRSASSPRTRSTCRSASRSTSRCSDNVDPQPLGPAARTARPISSRPDEPPAAFTATTAGIYRGQCAEFCGLEHAQDGVPS